MHQFNHQSGEHLTAGDTRIYYEVQGSSANPVLLLLHGGLGNMADFNGILPELGTRYRLLGIDSRGHGKSTLGSEPLTYAQIEQDIIQVLERLRIHSFSVLGFSDGGILAYRLALNGSVKPEKIVTIGADWHEKNQGPMRNKFMQITGESWRKKFPESYEAYQSLNPEPDFNHFVATVVNMWLDTTPAGYPGEAIRGITTPLLIMRGANDHLFSDEGAHEVAARVKGSRIVNIPGTGHMAFEEQPAVFLRHLNGFL